MIYLDYSATTKIEPEVLDSLLKAEQSYYANPNSMHSFGLEAKKLIDSSTQQVASILGVKETEIIYTSGASEANNLAIKSIARQYQNRGRHIITTAGEHPSVYEPFNYLKANAYEIDIIPLKDAKLDLEAFKALLREDTILVSVTAVSSETGVQNPLDELAEIMLDYPKSFLHVDMTQAIGKIKIDMSKIDLASLSAHKFYGPKGIGLLYKKENLSLEPQIHGGSSTTVFRSGTPPTSLILGLSKALRLANEDLASKYAHVAYLNKKLRAALKTYENIKINSPEEAIPHIINLSFLNAKPETVQHMFEEKEIFISTQTACHSKDDYSKEVLALTNDKDRAKNSLRISLSFKTSEEEIDIFLKALAEIYQKLETLK